MKLCRGHRGATLLNPGVAAGAELLVLETTGTIVASFVSPVTTSASNVDETFFPWLSHQFAVALLVHLFSVSISCAYIYIYMYIYIYVCTYIYICMHMLCIRIYFVYADVAVFVSCFCCTLRGLVFQSSDHRSFVASSESSLRVW